VLGAGVAQALFPVQDPIGRVLRVDGDRYFRVVGVTTPAARSAVGDDSLIAQDYNQDVYIPFTTDALRFGQTVSFDRARTRIREILEISRITVAVDDVAHVKETAQIIGRMVSDNHPLGDTAITVPLELLEQAEQTQRMFTMVLGAIASVSLVVGGIGIMNIMLATITERTREIGIRRAIGATRQDISRQFAIETVVLAGSGGLVGLGMGVAVAYLLGSWFTLDTIVRPWSPLLALTISVAVGLVFGAYPAHRAARMDPIKALRHE
jgi:putative ABC transport system permease protein